MGFCSALPCPFKLPSSLLAAEDEEGFALPEQSSLWSLATPRWDASFSSSFFFEACTKERCTVNIGSLYPNISQKIYHMNCQSYSRSPHFSSIYVICFELKSCFFLSLSPAATLSWLSCIGISLAYRFCALWFPSSISSISFLSLHSFIVRVSSISLL